MPSPMYAMIKASGECPERRDGYSRRGTHESVHFTQIRRE
jgi:hypothetical protein